MISTRRRNKETGQQMALHAKIQQAFCNNRTHASTKPDRRPKRINLLKDEQQKAAFLEKI
jgi:hypothetical protein